MKLYNTLLLASLMAFNDYQLYSQNNFADLAFDKNEDKYVVGNFDQTIDLGNNNLISSNGSSDIFIGKYDKKNVCQWVTKIGGKFTDNVSSIFVEQSGNFYITGYFMGEAKFEGITVKQSANKNAQSATLFVAKYNTSGDPIWVKTSKNISPDAGYGITTDNYGNVFIIGTFEGQFIFDGKELNSNGKNDICIIKLNSSGKCEWIKNYGGKEDNLGNTILFHKNKIVIGGNSQIESGTYIGYLAEISAETGVLNWSKTIGVIKADIEKITIDNTSNYLVTGSIENSVANNEGYNLFVNKINASDGKDIWMKTFPSHQAKGKDIVSDLSGTMFLTGSFTDSLNLNGIHLYGSEADDVFLAKMGPSGKIVWAKNYGHNKNDVGCKLILQNSNLILVGEYTTGIEFGKIALSGGSNSIFITEFDTQKLIFNNAVTLVKEDPNVNSNSKYKNISGKLLIGAGTNKSFLNDQAIFIEDENGNFMKKTVTDENGDFSFKNIDISTTVNLVLEKNDKLKETDEIYLSQQNGIIVEKLEIGVNKNFQYRLLPLTMSKLIPLEDEKDPVMVMKDFKTSKAPEFTLIERILYEPNSSSIPPESKQTINQIAMFLKQNPKMKIEIYSHTDSNGEDNYNLILSEKRGNEVKDLLMKKQIQSDRIIVKGLGETVIINRCTNGVKCTDTEHSYNRRTEFKFIKGSGL